MKYSVLKKPVASVPSSGRPTWLATVVTSGYLAKTFLACRTRRVASVGATLDGNVPRAQIVPSSECGRNSAPVTPGKQMHEVRIRSINDTPAVTHGCWIHHVKLRR